MAILSYDEIEKTTKWVAKMTYGRFVGTYDEVSRYTDDHENLRDLDILATQPTQALQDFWDAHLEFICKYFFLTAKEFYDTLFSKAPEAFIPEKYSHERESRKRLFSLSDKLCDSDILPNIVIYGFDRCAGNHVAHNWSNALALMGDIDFDVIDWYRRQDTEYFTILCTEDDIKELSRVTNEFACQQLFCA